jgi:hypothetical protein
MVEKARAPGLKRQLAASSPPILDIQLRGNSFVSANCGIDLADPLNYLSFKTHKFPQLASTAGGSPCGHDQIDLQNEPSPPQAQAPAPAFARQIGTLG